MAHDDTASTSTSTRVYMGRLKRALDLILDSVPDNKDDTINSKLLDSLRSDLSSDSVDVEHRRALTEFLLSFLDKEILADAINNNNYVNCNLAAKEPEVVKFFIDLTAIALTSTPNLAFLRSVLSFVLSVLRAHFVVERLSSDTFDVESSVCCSLFELVQLVYTLSDNTRTQLEEAEAEAEETLEVHSTLHGRVLDECLMRAECVKFFLDVDYKSMFVRSAFKALVKQHLIATIERLTNNDNDDESRHRIASICATFAAMSVRNRLSNMDIFSDVLRHFLFSSKRGGRSDDMRVLACLRDHLLAHLPLSAEARAAYLASVDDYNNDSIVESFAYLLACHELLAASSSTASSFCRSMLVHVNTVADHFLVTAQALIATAGCRHSASKAKKCTNLLLRFLAYVFEFVDELDTSYERMSAPLVRLFELLEEQEQGGGGVGGFQRATRLIKVALVELFTVPLRLRFNNNNNNESLTTTDNQVVEAAASDTYEAIYSSWARASLLRRASPPPPLDIALKHLLLRQCLSHLTLFVRKYAASVRRCVHLFGNSNSNNNNMKRTCVDTQRHVLYVLRQLDVAVATKNQLLQLLVDYFSSQALDGELLALLQHVCVDILLATLGLKCDTNTLSGALFQLLAVWLVNIAEQQQQQQALPLAQQRIVQCIRQQRQLITNSSGDNMTVLLQFITRLLHKSATTPAALVVAMRLIADDECFLLRECCCRVALDDAETELRDTVYTFMASVCSGGALRQQHQHEPINDDVDTISSVLVHNETFVRGVERCCLREREAFVRREMMSFLCARHACALRRRRSSSSSSSSQLEENIEIEQQRSAFFAHFLLNDFDWQVQLHCIAHVRHLLLVIEEEKEKELELELELLARVLHSLLASLDDQDQYVVQAAARLLLELKTNDKISRRLSTITETTMPDRSDYVTELKRESSPLNDADEQMNVVVVDSHALAVACDSFVASTTTSVEVLAERLAHSSTTGDFYALNGPMAILDDIISSYQFELDDEKAVDCY